MYSSVFSIVIISDCWLSDVDGKACMAAFWFHQPNSNYICIVLNENFTLEEKNH